MNGEQKAVLVFAFKLSLELNEEKGMVDRMKPFGRLPGFQGAKADPDLVRSIFKMIHFIPVCVSSKGGMISGCLFNPG